MIAALLTAGVLQMDPSAFAAACMEGGGAPGHVEAISNREVSREVPIAVGSAPVTLTITMNRLSQGEKVWIWIDGDSSLTVPAGGSAIVSGRRIVIGANENQTFDYCLRVQPR